MRRGQVVMAVIYQLAHGDSTGCPPTIEAMSMSLLQPALNPDIEARPPDGSVQTLANLSPGVRPDGRVASRPGLSQSNAGPSKTGPAEALKDRDGQHDFDFEIGTWKTRLSRLLHPLTGSTTWVEYEGTTVVRKVWNGRANLVELDVDGPAGHIEGSEPAALQSRIPPVEPQFLQQQHGGTLSPPVDRRVQEWTGRVFRPGDDRWPRRSSFDSSSRTSRRLRADFEQAFSDDGGKTWEVNWIATDTRVKGSPNKAP